jgi:hypothetical protein
MGMGGQLHINRPLCPLIKRSCSLIHGLLGQAFRSGGGNLVSSKPSLGV